MAKISVTMLGQFGVTVDTVRVDESHWARRHAAALVKVLALAPGLRLHREQVLDLLWPDDTVDEAAPKLHKAAHFARAAPSTCRTRSCSAATPSRSAPRPRPWSTSWSSRTSPGAPSPTTTSPQRAPRSPLYGGELLPDDRYEDWAEERREQLRLRHLDLLRLDGQWETVVELDPSDEVAHLALMRRHAANGDRHAALRQFERMDRALRRELGVAPGREAIALRDRLLGRARRRCR